MPSDLNLKKSWHPSLLKNQRKIHELEQSALQEHRAITERGAEMTRERERLELLALQYGGAVPEHVKKKLTLGWMYDDKSDEPSVLPGAGESDEFLLGKRRVDTLVEKGKEKSQLERVMETGELPPAKLLHEDPMMKIMRSRQQHAAKMRSREGSGSRREESERSDSKSHRRCESRKNSRHESRHKSRSSGSRHESRSHREESRSHREDSPDRSSERSDRNYNAKYRDRPRERSERRSNDRDPEGSSYRSRDSYPRSENHQDGGVPGTRG